MLENIPAGHGTPWSRDIDKSDTLLTATLGFWTLSSALVLQRIGFFRTGPLAAAPVRESQLNAGLLLAVVVLYLVVGALGGRAGQVVAQAYRLSPPPSPMASTGTATASAPGRSAVDKDFIWENAGAGVAHVGLAVFLLLLIRPVVTGGLSGFGLDPRKIVRGMGLGVIAALLLVPWYLWVTLATEQVSQYLRHGAAPPVHPVLTALREKRAPLEVAALVGIAVVCAPLIEELIFRGVMQTYLLRFGRRRVGYTPSVPMDSREVGDGPLVLAYQRATPPSFGGPSASWRWFCIVTASVLFAAIHVPIMGPEAFPLLFVLSITLGYLYERTGNLWACMVLHGLFNLTGVVMARGG